MKTKSGSIFKYNENVFAELNEQSLYWLGFLYADGCMQENKKGHKYVQLNIVDEAHLYKFKTFLETDSPVHTYLLQMNKANNKRLKISSIVIHNKKITEDLYRLGLIPRKSLILEFPKFIPDNMLHHFIRGYFDGDGCVSIDLRKRTIRPRLVFVGTFNFVNAIKSIFEKQINHPCPTPNKNSQSNIYNLYINNRHHVTIIRDYLFQNATIWLDRKYEKLFSFNFYEKRGCSSKHKNVCFSPKINRWRATYRKDNGKRTDKQFKTEEEAFNFLQNNNYN